MYIIFMPIIAIAIFLAGIAIFYFIASLAIKAIEKTIDLFDWVIDEIDNIFWR